MADNKKNALRFVLLIGIVSLFADITYEGARSITGPFLAVLAASGTAVGIAAGLGELIGYGLRLLTGFLSDKTKKYWLLTILGYSINLFAVPLLALAGNWQIAIFLMITERIGKAIRTPARDTLLSSASSQIGQGWAFGLHEALDQIGAILGPIIVAIAFLLGKDYRIGFAILLIPALMALLFLLAARFLYPKPESFEKENPKRIAKIESKSFWIYIVAISCIAAGYADFPLIAFHFKKTLSVPENFIPVTYSIAMATDAIAALVFGKLFDKKKIFSLIFAVIFSAFFAPLVFLGDFTLGIIGMILWGIGMGAQESIFRATIALMIPLEKRGTAFGLFNMVYGLAWFLGSALMGILYDVSLLALIIFSVICQLVSIPLFLFLKRKL